MHSILNILFSDWTFWVALITDQRTDHNQAKGNMDTTDQTQQSGLQTQQYHETGEHNQVTIHQRVVLVSMGTMTPNSYMCIYSTYSTVYGWFLGFKSRLNTYCTFCHLKKMFIKCFYSSSDRRWLKNINKFSSILSKRIRIVI